MTRPAPTADVLAAFGVGGSLTRLPGGRGRTWRAGDLILKPCDQPEEANWVAYVQSSLAASSRFRVATPVRGISGGWVVSGWQAWRAIPGEPDVRRIDAALDAAEAFHEAISGLPRPGFLDTRDDPWSYGDRVAWDELPINRHGVMADLLQRLADARRPVDLPAQPAHGDLLGNVLYADGLAPAIIDWSVYFRPTLWAQAVVVVDALTWGGASEQLISWGGAHGDWGQMLVRALMYRIATNDGVRRIGEPVRERPEDYHVVVALVLRELALRG